MKRPRVLLAGIPISLLAAYNKTLGEEFEIVGTSADGRGLMATAIQLQPDILVFDLALSSLSDASTRLELKRLIPQTRFLVITGKEDLDLAFEAIPEWASGVLLKRTAKRELLGAVRELMKNKLYLPARVVQGAKDAQNRSSLLHRQKSLTRRQREVLQLLAQGKTMKETADVLRLSLSAVAFHKYNIKRAFGLRGNVELIRLAIRENLASAE